MLFKNSLTLNLLINTFLRVSMFECVFCDKKFTADVDLSKHEESCHSDGMWQCVACTDVKTLFNNYNDVVAHSKKIHNVDIGFVIQSSVYPSKYLLKMR